MITLKLISILVPLGIILGFCQEVESVNITDACIKKSPSIQINSTEKNAEQRSLLFIFDTTGTIKCSQIIQ